METATLNPTQMHLLKLFAFNNSEEYAREIQMVLTRKECYVCVYGNPQRICRDIGALHEPLG